MDVFEEAARGTVSSPLQLLRMGCSCMPSACTQLEVKEERRPIVVVSFSGGVKACQYKFLTLLLREASQEKNMKHALDATPSYKVLRQCIAGQIFDSCPIDFVSQIGARFLSQPPGTGKSQRSSARAAAASAAAVVMDAIFLREFEKQRADVWEVLRRSAIFGPVLLFFSKNDELAPHERVSQFAAEMAKNGSKVTAICWDVSEHVGHLRHHPDEYSRNVVKFLEYVLDTWSRRIQAGGEHEVVVGPSGDENLQIGVNSIIGHYEIPDLRTAARTDSSPEPRPFIRSKL